MFRRLEIRRLDFRRLNFSILNFRPHSIIIIYKYNLNTIKELKDIG